MPPHSTQRTMSRPWTLSAAAQPGHKTLPQLVQHHAARSFLCLVQRENPAPLFVIDSPLFLADIIHLISQYRLINVSY
jgi:hypothetical protein